MADIVFGILIKGKDLASKAFDATATSARRLGTSIRDAGSKAAKAAKEIAGSAVNINAMMEIGKKVFGALSRGFQAVTSAALEQRAATDQQAKDWAELGRTVERIAGLIGDILIPIVLGVADAFASSTKGAEAFLGQNRALIGSKIVEYLASMASTLVRGVATGLVLVSRAWTGLREIVGLVKFAVEAAFAGMIKGAEVAIGAFESLASAVGADGLAASLASAKEEAALMSATFGESADQHLAEVARMVAEQEALEAAIADVAAKVQDGIGRAAVAAFARLNQEIRKVAPGAREAAEAANKLAIASLKAQEMAAQGHAMRVALAADLYQSNLERIAEAEERADAKQKERFEKLKARAQEMVSEVTSFASGLVGSARSAFAGIGEEMNGQIKTWRDALASFLDSIASMIIEKLVQSGIAKIAGLIGSALTGGGLGIFGAIGGAISGLFGAGAVGVNRGGTIRGYNSGGIHGYAGAGIVSGPAGSPNRDTTLAALTVGEGVLSRETTKRVVADLSGRGGSGQAPASIAESPRARQVIREVKETRALYALTSRAHLDTFQRNTALPSAARLERYRAQGA